MELSECSSRRLMHLWNFSRCILATVIWEKIKDALTSLQMLNKGEQKSLLVWLFRHSWELLHLSFLPCFWSMRCSHQHCDGILRRHFARLLLKSRVFWIQEVVFHKASLLLSFNTNFDNAMSICRLLISGHFIRKADIFNPCRIQIFKKLHSRIFQEFFRETFQWKKSGT